MRVIDTKILNAAQIPPEGRVFLGFWYSMTHPRSLDSYRVRCMNSRTLIREISDEITLGIIDDQEFKALAQETLSVLNGDTVIREHFLENLNITSPLLAAPPKLLQKEPKEKDKEKAAEEQEKYRHLRFAVEDFRAALEKNYFRYLCDALEKAVKPNNEDEIRLLTGALLSDLVDREWPLESLFRWHNHFLTQRDHTFQQNLSFMLRLLKRESQSFEVTLRLSGTTKIGQIGKHGLFTISADSGLTPTGNRETRFCKRNVNVCFGKATVTSVDATAAAIKARMEFQQLLDLLRFEFERGVVTVDQRSHVLRVGDRRTELCVVRHTVPNPIESLDHEDFFEFAKQVDNVLASNAIDANSKRRLQAAIRQYRFGRDKEGYEDKFLNWWMGLESLCYGGQGGGIGKVVVWNASYGMLNNYLNRILRDLLIAIKYCQVAWPSELAEHCQCHNLKDLSIGQLLTILQSGQHRDQLWGQLPDYPVVLHYGKKIAAWLLDPKKMAAHLEEHLNHLHWHMSRLYRIRCCIVHGSPVRFRLALFAANIEYYLKQTIHFVLNSFRNYEHITGLDELFCRGRLAASRVLDRLKEAKATPDDAREAVFADVVVRDHFVN